MPCLLILSGPNDGQMQTLVDGTFVLGRGEDSDIQIVDEKASRKHCELSSQSNTDTGSIALMKWSIRDLGSSNGTSINGQALTDAHPLSDGFLISIGTTRLMYLERSYDTAEEAREYADSCLRIHELDSGSEAQGDDSWPLDPPWKSRTLGDDS
jgi:pSer/pThr/pTyr-binding forkhead associated (FHA) protein